jgi:DNA polymerase III epsilon subunit-like protein
MNTKIKYIAYDLETTDEHPHCSDILTGYFAFLNQDFQKIDELQIKCKPNDNQTYRVNPNALEVNKIDLIRHHKEALPYSVVSKNLETKLELHTNYADPASALIYIGHNCGFDKFFIKTLLIPKWDYYVKRKGLDTALIATFLQEKGTIPKNLNTSLKDLAEFFGISNENAHTSHGDVLMTIEIVKKMLNL